MVILTAAAVTAGAVGAYKGGQAAVNGVKEKVKDVKKGRERNKQKKEEKERQQVMKEEEERVRASQSIDDRLSIMRGKHSTRKPLGEKKKNPLARFRKGN